MEGCVNLRTIDEYSVKVTVPVAWGEMDSFGHVNNIIFFRYFETARIDYFKRVGFIEEMENSGIGPILASTSAKFIKPLFYPDTVHIGTRVTDLRSTKFTMDYLLYSEKNGTAAVGEALIVVLNYQTSTKSPLPPKVKEKILELEPDLIEQRS